MSLPDDYRALPDTPVASVDEINELLDRLRAKIYVNRLSANTDSSGMLLIYEHLRLRDPVALVFTDAEDKRAHDAGFVSVYVHGA